MKQRRIMVVDGKGGKDRVVYISEDAVDGLLAYLKQIGRASCRERV